MRTILTPERAFGLLLALFLISAPILIAGCGGAAAPSSTPPPAATKAADAAASTATVAIPTVAAAATQVAPTAATVAAKAAGTTAGQLADAGKTVYADNCAKCHGDQGQGVTGPTLIGPNAKFGRFKNGQEFFSYISTNMPMDHPGSLTPDQALQVTAYLLVQNNVVQRDASLTSTGLSSIQFKQ